MATYKQAYEAYLVNRMEEGGTPAAMEACLLDYNTVSLPTFVPQELYKEWFYGESHVCTTCAKEFKFTTIEPVKTEDETTCHVCLSRSTTEDDENGTSKDSGSAE
jgi:DNA-directed RNA polymerase subunit RPC12/RpoP